MGRPLSEPCLAAIEQELKATIPEEYRRVLTELGNGGAGPNYGLFSLTEDSRGRRDMEDITDYARLGKPFHYTEATRTSFRPLPGALYLCHRGCALRTFLVVTGPCRGEVWNDDRVDTDMLNPTRLNFFAWYEKWLDESLAELTETSPVR